jgi:ABC-type transporter Mla maintaining outer membrane lipid asymmetry ATPase subunit MlaF
MALVDVRGVVKRYGGLRPFRLRGLSVEAGETVAIAGLDEQAAAVFTDLLTATTLPDEGDVVVAGRPTASIAKPDDWLAFLDRFGLVNSRTVLLDALSVVQNLALAHTLDLDPVPETERRLVEATADEVGLPRDALDRPLPAGSALTRLRVRLGRALAHRPSILVVEHPALGLGPGDAAEAARVIERVGRRPGLAVLVLTSSRGTLRLPAARALAWNPSTGALRPQSRWWRLLGR